MKSVKTTFRKYLGALKPRDSFAALIHAKGKWFVGRSSSKDFLVTKLWKEVNKPRAGDCYFNSQQFCIDCGDHRYMEGYVLIEGALPIEHAWILMEGNVIDFTLEAMERKAKQAKVKVDTSNALYLGVEVPLPFLRKRISETQMSDTVAEQYYATVNRKSRE